MRVDLIQIGDYFAYPTQTTHDGKLKIGRVNFIRHDGFVQVDFADTNAQLLEPIEITPSILENNGFITEEKEGDPTFPYLAFIIENDEYRIEITWYDSHDVYESNTGEYLHGAPEVWNMEILGKCGNYDFGKNKLYLHELQHALKLCGIEKDIII